MLLGHTTTNEEWRDDVNYNFIKVCAATPQLVVADCHYNTEQIIACINQAEEVETELIVFPELSITGCCPLKENQHDDLCWSALKARE